MSVAFAGPLLGPVLNVQTKPVRQRYVSHRRARVGAPVRMVDSPPRARPRYRVPSPSAPPQVPRVKGEDDCTKCEGKGWVPCTHCDEFGFLPVSEGVWATCPECRGSGRVMCDACEVELLPVPVPDETDESATEAMASEVMDAAMEVDFFDAALEAEDFDVALDKYDEAHIDDGDDGRLRK